MLLQIETKTIDVNTWNALIFIVTTLITVLLGVIAYYQKSNSDSQKEIVKEITSMGKDMVQIKYNGVNMGKDVERIRKDVDHFETKLNDHDKRIYHLEKVG
jgi:peptidoglycan hydrolase CwlO-like protein